MISFNLSLPLPAGPAVAVSSCALPCRALTGVRGHGRAFWFAAGVAALYRHGNAVLSKLMDVKTPQKCANTKAVVNIQGNYVGRLGH
jgi:hypothetical protein